MNKPAVSRMGITVAVIASIAATLILLFLTNESPVESFFYFFTGQFQNSFAFGNFLNTAFILSLTGLGIAVAFKGGFFNIGGEAQVYAGALSAALVGAALYRWPGVIGIPVILIAAIVTGAVIGGISGLLKALWNVDELISSFLISATFIPLIDFLISIPFRDPQSYLMSTKKLADQLHIWKFSIPSDNAFWRGLDSSNLNFSLFIIIILLVAVWLIFRSTIYGYELRILGTNREFAGYGGIRVKAYAAGVMAVSGALHSFAGGLVVLGSKHAAIQGMTSGLGWNGIAVALIARNNPALIFPAALIFAYIEAGTRSAMIYSNFDFEFSAIIQAAVFFLVTAKKLGSFKRRSE